MASQNEMHEGTRNEQDKKTDRDNSSGQTNPINVEAEKQPPPPFSEHDPFRAYRYSEVTSETQTFLDSMGLKASGFEDADENQLRTLSKDVEERQRWRQARSDAFRGIVRLGTATPPRGKRLL